MSAPATSVGVTYFGKLPSQRDFVKSTDNHQLLALLDRWAERGLESLARDVDWKQHYDNAPQLSFAFVGSRSHVAVAGHFAPAHDASGRRYPFLSAARIEVPEPLAFIRRCPMALSDLWTDLAQRAGRALGSSDTMAMLQELGQARFNIDPSNRRDARLEAFLDHHSLGSLRGAIRAPGQNEVRLERTIPALGVLLQPLLTRPRAELGRGLSLPLPADPLLQAPAATLWLQMIAGFVSRGHYELAVVVRPGDPATLVIGFDGASADGLHALLDPRVAATRNIDLANPVWADDAVEADPALGRLASYLAEDGLSLRRARDTFLETFLGA